MLEPPDKNIQMTRELPDDIKLFFEGMAMGIGSLLVFIAVTGVLLQDWMNQYIGNLGYPLTVTIIATLLISILIYRTDIANIYQIRFLLILFLGLVLFNFFQIFNWSIAVENTPFNRPLDAPLLHLADMFIIVVTIALYYHFESIKEGDPNLVMLALIGLFTLPYVTLSFMVILFENQDANNLQLTMLPFFAIAVIIITIYGINIMFKIYLNTENKKNKQNALIITFGLFYALFAFVSQVITDDFLNFGFVEAEIYQLAILSLGIMLIGVTYINDPSFLYVTLSTIHQCLLLDENSEIVWSYQPWPKVYSEDELSTLAKILKTSSIMLELLGGSFGSVEKIDFTSTGTIYTKAVNNYQLLFVIEEHSRYLQSAINIFTHRIESLCNQADIDTNQISSQFKRTFQLR